MATCNMSEVEVMKALVDVAKANGDQAARCIVYRRTQPENSITRSVTFALIVASENEPLLDALINASIAADRAYEFIGSEINLQNGTLEVEYLFFKSSIMAKMN